MNPKLLIIAVLPPWILWRYYQRIRQNIGRQTFKPFRAATYAATLAFLIGLMVYFTRSHTDILAGLASGLVLGVASGIVALKLTNFEPTAEGMHYTPNRYIGLAVTAVLILRVAYRFYFLYSRTGMSTRPDPMMTYNPLTLLTVGLVLGYFVTYDTGLLWQYIRRAKATSDRPVA